MPRRGKNKYIPRNFQRSDIGRVKISKKEDELPELTLETSIQLEDTDVPELEDMSNTDIEIPDLNKAYNESKLLK